MKLKKKLFINGVAIALLLSMSSSCYYDNREELNQFVGEPCDSESATYSEDISIIMDRSCAVGGCHDAQTNQSGINLSTYSGTSNAVLNGAVIQRIELSQGEPGLMPASGRLPQCDIDKIKAWANQGAPNN